MQARRAKYILDNLLQELTSDFILNDPISIPHIFVKPEDIEIIGFITALISWGKRSNIIKAGKQLANIFEYEPYNFLVNASEEEMQHFRKFYYRTFQPEDSFFIISKLQELYKNKSSLKNIFHKGFLQDGIKGGIYNFRKFILGETEHRSKKHLPNPYKGSACKRINMYLRWMVRKDFIDFGIWSDLIPCSELKIPLDLHVGRAARELNILQRKQNDWKAVEELTAVLKEWNPEDPIIYDFALFLYSHNKK